MNHPSPPTPPIPPREPDSPAVKDVWRKLLAFGFLTLFLVGCGSPGETVGAFAGGVVGTTLVGGYSPAHEIEQIYYLGVFDPQEQVPPMVYRLTVHGQASALSNVKFGSGWVPAQVIDSLTGQVNIDANISGNGISIVAAKDHLAEIKPERRLIQFGPEGFREAPADHRLVIVMGASPKAFFEAIDRVLGSVSAAQAQVATADLRQELFRSLIQVQKERERLRDLESDISRDFQTEK
jgi:hypothetical protein